MASLDRNLLLAVATSDDSETVGELLQRGADKDAKDEDGYTALMWTAMRGHNEAAKALVVAGAGVGTGLPKSYSDFAMRAYISTFLPLLITQGVQRRR